MEDYTYGNALFIVINANNYNAADHEALIKKAIKANPNTKWRIVVMHQDIYGSGLDHSDSDGILLRTQLTPIYDANKIDVVLQLADGEQVTANCPNGLLFGTVCEPGMSVVVIASKTGSLSSYTVYSYDRMTAVAGFLAFFARAGTSKGISGLIQPVTKEGLRFERSPSFSPFFLLLSSSITGSVHELAVLRYGYDTGLAALVVGDSIGSVAADGRIRHVLDLCLWVQGLHDVCRDLLADFRRALQHEQAAPDTQTDDCQNPVLHNTKPFP